MTTEEKQRLAQEYAEGASLRALGRRRRLSHESIRQLLLGLGVELRPRNARERGVCQVEDCGRPHQGHGLCQAHLWRLQRHGDTRADQPIQKGPLGRICSVEGCGRRHEGKGLCHTHRQRRARGAPLEPPVRRYTRRAGGGAPAPAPPETAAQ